MKNIFYIAFVSLLPLVSFSQNGEIPFEEKMKMQVKNDQYSWAYKNVFLDYKLGAATEIFKPRAKTYEYSLYSYNGASTPYDTVTLTDKGINISILHFAIEPRINLYNQKKYSVFVKAPIGLSLSVFAFSDKGYLSRGAGVFNFNVPLLFGYARGLNHSFSNASKRGFAISAGVQYMRAPLIGAKDYTFDHYALKPVGEGYVLRKSWITPLIQFDYYRLTRKNKIRGYSLAFSPGKDFYLKLAFNIVGKKK